MRRRTSCIAAVVVWTLATISPHGAGAQPHEDAGKDVTELSIEELLNVEVTSVTRRAQRLSDSAAAVHVMTRADIRRSGATNIPDVLRLVPGVQVARIDSNKWAVSIRGFNSRFANKLLVLVDGRTAYSPLYSGVYWEALDMPLEEIERIEVIRGPGGTMWGVNAVNGVINIITAHAREGQGLTASAQMGTDGPGRTATVRQGWHLGETGGLRVYAKGFHRDWSGPANPHDSWGLMRAGFRADGGTATNGFSLMGTAFGGDFGQAYGPMPGLSTLAPGAPGDVHVHGAQFAGSMTRGLRDGSTLTVRSYVDHFQRDELVNTDRRFIGDLDAQHRLRRVGAHDVMWGGGYRYYADHERNSPFATFTPERLSAHLVNVFVQDEVTLRPSLRVTGGVKYEQSTFGGGGWQPSVRGLWNLSSRQAVWASASRALRTASRAEMTVEANGGILPPTAEVPLPTVVMLLGTPELRPEILWAYETGYRVQVSDRVSLDLAAFANDYDRLTGTRPGTPSLRMGASGPYLSLPIVAGNLGTRQSRGFEASIETRPMERVRVVGAYTWLAIGLPDADDLGGNALGGQDPRHQFTLRTQFDVGGGLEIDPTLRAVGRLQGGAIPGYAAWDVHVGRRLTRALNVSFVALDLTGANRFEFQPAVVNTIPARVPRTFLGSVTWRY